MSYRNYMVLCIYLSCWFSACAQREPDAKDNQLSSVVSAEMMYQNPNSISFSDSSKQSVVIADRVSILMKSHFVLCEALKKMEQSCDDTYNFSKHLHVVNVESSPIIRLECSLKDQNLGKQFLDTIMAVFINFEETRAHNSLQNQIDFIDSELEKLEVVNKEKDQNPDVFSEQQKYRIEMYMLLEKEIAILMEKHHNHEAMLDVIKQKNMSIPENISIDDRYFKNALQKYQRLEQDASKTQETESLRKDMIDHLNNSIKAIEQNITEVQRELVRLDKEIEKTPETNSQGKLNESKQRHMSEETHRFLMEKKAGLLIQQAGYVCPYKIITPAHISR